MPKTFFLRTEIPIIDRYKIKVFGFITLYFAFFPFIVYLRIHNAKHFDVYAVCKEITLHLKEWKAWLINMRNVVFSKPIINFLFIKRFYNMPIRTCKFLAAFPARSVNRYFVFYKSFLNCLSADTKFLCNILKTIPLIVKFIENEFLGALIISLRIALRPSTKFRDINAIFFCPISYCTRIAIYFIANVSQRSMILKNCLYQKFLCWLNALGSFISTVEPKMFHSIFDRMLTHTKAFANLSGSKPIFIIKLFEHFGVVYKKIKFVHKHYYITNLVQVQI